MGLRGYIARRLLLTFGGYGTAEEAVRTARFQFLFSPNAKVRMKPFGCFGPAAERRNVYRRDGLERPQLRQERNVLPPINRLAGVYCAAAAISIWSLRHWGRSGRFSSRRSAC